MSLAQHVTQAEGFDYERLSCHDPIIRPANGREASAESVIEPAKWRRMSFAPVDFPYQRPRTAAYRVSTAKRRGMFHPSPLLSFLANQLRKLRLRRRW